MNYRLRQVSFVVLFLTLTSKITCQSKKTNCYESMGTFLCNNIYRPQCELCGQLMPEHEEIVMFDCAKIIAENVGRYPPRGWHTMSTLLCRPPIARKAINMLKCFRNTLNATVQKGEFSPSDGIFPLEHFKCRDHLLNEAIKNLSASCRKLLGLSVKNTLYVDD